MMSLAPFVTSAGCLIEQLPLYTVKVTGHLICEQKN